MTRLSTLAPVAPGEKMMFACISPAYGRGYVRDSLHADLAAALAAAAEAWHVVAIEQIGVGLVWQRQ